MNTELPTQELLQPPPCVGWDIWIGNEVEGTASRGVPTLFIRSLKSFPNVSHKDNLSVFRQQSKCTRVWFCKEFRDWKIMAAIAQHFDEYCVEVEPKGLLALPLRIRQTARIYLKVILPTQLKAGDHICVGLPFADESFAIGTGVKVQVSDYLKDRKIA